MIKAIITIALCCTTPIKFHTDMLLPIEQSVPKPTEIRLKKKVKSGTRNRPLFLPLWGLPFAMLVWHDCCYIIYKTHYYEGLQ